MDNLSLVRRSLAERRQRLGCLPTLWFWNDREHQRLLMPLTLLVALPLGLLLFVFEALGASPWLTPLVCLVLPFVLMGLVERHIRASLRRSSRVSRRGLARATTGPRDS